MIKRIIAFASMIVVAFALVGCSSSSSKPEMDGFDSSTNNDEVSAKPIRPLVTQ
ncbi:MAG: hypothetical protein ACI4BI_03855 [Anaerotardibacter sp.]